MLLKAQSSSLHVHKRVGADDGVSKIVPVILELKPLQLCSLQTKEGIALFWGCLSLHT